MHEIPKKDDKPIAASPHTRDEGGPGAPERARLGIRLAPVNNSDQPVLANYTSISPAPGMVFIDFGFLEPALLAAIPRVAKQGGKLPQSVNGKLAVRVAMSYDALAGLQQQLGRVLAALRASTPSRKGN